MATIGDLVRRARRMLRGARREPFNLLDGAHTDSVDQLTLQLPLGRIALDDYLGVGPEICYVTAKDEGQQKVTVIRGFETPAVAHDHGTAVEINWRYLSADLANYLVDEIRSWPDSIYSVETVDVSMGVASREIDLPMTRFRYALELRRKTSGRPWVNMPKNSFRVETGLPTSDYPSGNTLVVSATPDTAQYRLTYAQGFDLSVVTDFDTDVADIGMSENLYDAAIHGVAWRALLGDESSRFNDIAQPEPREADEVGPGDVMAAASACKAIRDQRLAEEKRRLQTLHSIRI